MTLEKMIKIYKKCVDEYWRDSTIFPGCCKDCALSKPVHEYEEHPTFCEIISDLENNN